MKLRFFNMWLIFFLIIFSILPIAQVQAKEHAAKNVIFMIPDGFSTSYATNYRLYKGKEAVWDSMLVGMHRTYSANSPVTDSAAAATAMATGFKTDNGMISMSPDGKKLKTILEAAKEAGKGTGLVATSTITYATPAAFAAHVPSRKQESEIAVQYMDNEVDVILGGGRKYFNSILERGKEKGYEIVTNKMELSNVQTPQKLLGLFAGEGMVPELDRHMTSEPSLDEMTKVALRILKQNKKGFFLMVEGSQIDWAGHDNDAAWAMKDIEAFEKAVATALDFAKKDKNTLVVIAGDHDNGGMSVGAYDKYDAKLDVLRNVKSSGRYMEMQLDKNRRNAKEIMKKYAGIDLTKEEINTIEQADKPVKAINRIVSERALIGWTTSQHTGVDIPVYAYGPGSQIFRGLQENTELPKLMARVMNIKFP
ncbi:alkaline phosphatase [Lederbergia wuyishanensis]|uniref:Alkaline phosphatase n=1 Tax=Lederbergia wuyishanensis TaxID=1347903 RepID=A0ABU0D6Q7_9BACI|nr:alkaline phosphatase [Lederbergia wuyishanensis]MCJ8008782.1 alkaline phosphatase [Lederbergia wuyishanensis]MDQ0344103.1 alkaline phosphatase [Lederbergia wuyishanensis]